MASAGGHKATKCRTKRRRSPSETDLEKKQTSSGDEAKSGLAEGPRPGFEVEGKPPGRTRSIKSVSNDKGRDQKISGSAPRPGKASKVRTPQSTKTKGQVPDIPCNSPSSQLAQDMKPSPDVVNCGSCESSNRKIDRFTSQFLDPLLKASETYQKNDSYCPKVILQLQAVQNFVDEVEPRFQYCYDELKRHKTSTCRVKQDFHNSLQQILKINSDVSAINPDLQKSSGEHDSSEKLKQGHENRATGKATEANSLICNIPCSISSHPTPGVSGVVNRRSCKQTARDYLQLRLVEDIIRNKQIPFSRKWNRIECYLRQFLDGEDKAHKSEIADWSANHHAALEEISAIKNRNEILQTTNQEMTVVCQKFIMHMEAALTLVVDREELFDNGRDEFESARQSLCGLKCGLMNCLREVRQVRSDTGVLTLHLENNFNDQKLCEKLKPGHAKDDEQISGTSGSYSHDAPTPALLQAALTNARVAVTRLQNDISHLMRSRQDHTTRGTPKIDPDVFYARPNHSGYHLRAAVNSLLLEGFENESFNTLLGISKFLNPNDRTQNFYEYYLREQEGHYADSIDDPQYEQFYKLKVSLLGRLICPENIGTKMEVSCLEELGAPGQLPFSYRAAARKVWLLHKLAFSFEPPAAIFRVEAGVDVDANYMETAVNVDDHEDFVSKVGFMIAPGLRLRKTVMHSLVYLAAERKQPNEGSTVVADTEVQDVPPTD